MRAALHWLLLPMLLVGCAESEAITELVVYVEPDPAIESKIEALTIDVFDPKNRVAGGHGAQNELWTGSYSLSLVPRRGNTDKQFGIEVTALNDHQPIGFARVLTNYVAHERRYLRLVVEPTCSTECDAEKTCVAGTCRSASVDPGDLGNDPESAPTSKDLLRPRRSGGMATDAQVVDPTAADAGLRDSAIADGSPLDGAACVTTDMTENAADLATGSEQRLRDLAAVCVKNPLNCGATTRSFAAPSLPNLTRCEDDAGVWSISWSSGQGSAYRGLPPGSQPNDGDVFSFFDPSTFAAPFARLTRLGAGTYDVDAVSPAQLPLPAAAGPIYKGTCSVTLVPGAAPDTTTANVTLCPR